MQCDRVAVLSVARAYTLMKDLVDSPAISLGPAELEAAAFAIGRKVEKCSSWLSWFMCQYAYKIDFYWDFLWLFFVLMWFIFIPWYNMTPLPSPWLI